MTTEILLAPNPPSVERGAILFETERLVLRRWKSDDGPDLHRIADYAEVAKNLSHRFPFPYTLESAEASLKRWVDLAAATSPHYPTSIALCLKSKSAEDQPELIGSMGLSPGEGIEYRTWTLGYFLTPPHWGKGYMTEAVKGLTRWSFSTWPKLNRIEATFYHWNDGSEGVLRKCGFVREGVRRGATEKYGVINDDVVMGLIRSDVEGELDI
ncbi:acyl-CoA N-acyltransferase [Sarocladium strictum]